MNKKGLTLIEVLIVSSVFSILFLTMYSLLDLANILFRTNDVHAQLDQNALQTLRSIAREIGQTSPNTTPNHLTITQDANSNSVITFQIPVDWDNDGDVTSSGVSNSIEWGSVSNVGQTQGGTLNGWIRYSISGTQLMRELLDSSLNTVSGTSQVAANNVNASSGFTSTRYGTNNSILRLTLTLSGTDQAGQSGAARTFQNTFINETVLRNAVD